MPALLWSGVVTGCLYALGALGLVLVFKSSRIVNFAHGSLAGVSAFLVYAFSTTFLTLPWWAALLAAVANFPEGPIAAGLPSLFPSPVRASSVTRL